MLAVSASDSEPEEGLGIIAQLLRRRFNIRPSDDDDAAYEKLLHGLEPIVDRRLHSTAARLLAYLAGLRAAVVKTGEDRLDNLARFHRRAVATLCNLLQYDAAQRPSVLVVHRAQHLTERAVEVFAAAFRELKGSPITLVLLTTIKPPKALRPRSKRVVSVKLEPLDNAAMEQLARALLNLSLIHI